MVLYASIIELSESEGRGSTKNQFAYIQFVKDGKYAHLDCSRAYAKITWMYCENVNPFKNNSLDYSIKCNRMIEVA